MSELNQHINKYTESDIRNYLSGNLSSDQMHAIEQAALDDPFLADAIEGMQEATDTYGPELVHENLVTARKKLEERVQERRPGAVIPIFWKRAAIAAVVIIVAGTWLYTSSRNSTEQKEILAIDQKKEESAAPNDTSNSPQIEAATSKAPDNTDTFSLKKASTGTPEVSKDQNATFADSKLSDQRVGESKNELREKSPSKEIAAAPKAPITSASTESKSIESERVKKEESNNDDTDFDKELTDPDKKSAPARSQALVGKPAEYINIKIVDSNNFPIANASVTDLEKKRTYLTDQNGYLKLPKSDTVVDASIASVGYQSKQLQLKSDVELNKIQLSPAPNLSEVVVVGYGNQNAKRKEKFNLNRRAPKVMVQDAEPVIGWVEYNKYLDSAKSTINAPVSGDVVISFLVNKSGESSSYKIEQSVSDQQDQAALNIVKTGSAWRLLKGKKQRVYVIIRF